MPKKFSSNPYDLYTPSSGSSELSMRDEMNFTVYGGHYPEIAKGTKGLLRHTQLDTNKDAPIPCQCVDPVTKEHDRDTWCPICFGEGYLWKEKFITFYKVNEESVAVMDVRRPPGTVNITFNVCFLPSDIDVGKLDKIIEVDLDIEGNIIYPVRRIDSWHIQELIPLRGDNGRLEFNKLFLTEDDSKYLNPPGIPRKII